MWNTWSIFALRKFRGYSETLHALHTSEAIEKAGRKPGPKKDIIWSSKAIRTLILLLHVNFNLLVHWPFLYRGKLGHRSSQASPFPSSIPPQPPGTEKTQPSESQVQHLREEFQLAQLKLGPYSWTNQPQQRTGSWCIQSLLLQKPGK